MNSMSPQKPSSVGAYGQNYSAEDARRLAGLAYSTLPVQTIGGLPISWTNRETAAEVLMAQALARRGSPSRPFYSTSANGQVIVMCSEDQQVRQEFLVADQILADGMPMVWLARLKHRLPANERVATTDLFHDVAERAEASGATFYILGSDEPTNIEAVKQIKAEYPKLAVVGRRNGYFNLDEETGIINEINKLEPDFLWVGMGVPREQAFVSRNIERLTNVGVIKTSGGLFDFLSLKRSRAPKWMQTLGLEWLYRTMLEPRRLGPRYLRTNHKALLKMLDD